MLCLRRISLDAKSRLLFLSRSHSSTNDSMPKSTAISRLIHKKFLQQNGNNSPQAIFVFLQQRSLRTRAHALVQPVLKKKYKSAKDNYQKDKLELRGVRTKVFEDTDKSAEFKYGFGPSGTKPKDEWEKGLYRNLKKSFEKSGKSEEEFEQALKQINLDMIERFYMLITGVIVVFLIVVAFGTNLLVKLKNYFVVHLAQVLSSLRNTDRTAFERPRTKVPKTKDKSVQTENSSILTPGPPKPCYTVFRRFSRRDQGCFELGPMVQTSARVALSVWASPRPYGRIFSLDYNIYPVCQTGVSKFEFQGSGVLFYYFQERFKVKAPNCYERGSILALAMFIVWTMFVRLSLPASIVLFTVLQALSHFGVRAYFRMTCGRKEKPKPSTALPEYDMKSGTK